MSNMITISNNNINVHIHNITNRNMFNCIIIKDIKAYFASDPQNFWKEPRARERVGAADSRPGEGA